LTEKSHEPNKITTATLELIIFITFKIVYYIESEDMKKNTGPVRQL